MTHLVCPMGTGDTLSGCARYLKERTKEGEQDLTVVGVDAQQSNVSTAFYGTNDVTYDTAVKGLCTGHELPTMWYDYIDEIRSVKDEEAFERPASRIRIGAVQAPSPLLARISYSPSGTRTR